MTLSMKVVVVEDHDSLRDITVQALQDMGLQVQGVANAEDVDELPGPTADLFIIDLNLPGEDGISLARRIRDSHPHVAIIMVSSRRQLAEKMAGYDSGADFYLTKPTSMEEISAVIKVFARRLEVDSFKRKFGYTLDYSALTLCSHTDERLMVSLSVQESTILSALAKAFDNRLEFWQLMRLSDPPHAELSKNALEVQIFRLRKKLTAVGAPDNSIKVLRGYGYQLCVPLKVI
jgi:DNA-binding response OmpR family regulator